MRIRRGMWWMRLIRGKRRGCLREISRCRIEVGTGGQEMGVSDGLLKGRGESGPCMCVCAALAKSCLVDVGGAPSRSLFYSFSCITPFFVFSACLEIGSETLFDQRYKQVGWLLYLVACLSRIHVCNIVIAFGQHRPLAERQTPSLQHFITSHE